MNFAPLCLLRRGVALLLPMLAAVLSGCNEAAPPESTATPGTVAVIDLDRVATELGQQQQIAQSISERQDSLSAQWSALAQSYQQQLAQRQQQAADSPQGVELASWQHQANTTLSQAREQMQTQLAAHRAELLLQFREQIKPFAREAARQRGLSVIVTKNDSVVFDFTAAADITDDVVAAIRQSPATQTAVGEPAAAEIASQGDTLHR